MNFTSLLFFLSACSTPVQVEPSEPPNTVMVTVTQRADPTLNELVSLHQRFTVGRLRAMSAEVAAENADLGRKAQAITEGIAALTPVAYLGLDKDQHATYQDHVCTKTCRHYHVGNLTSFAGQRLLGVWNSNMRAIGVNAYVDINDAYLPFIMFHEGSHMLDPRSEGYVEPDFSTPEKMQSTAVPVESDAIDFECQLLNAVSRGRYAKLRTAWVKGIQLGYYASIKSSGITVAEVPEEIGRLMMKRGTMSAYTASGFYQIILFDLNRELINTSNLKPDEKQHELSLVYGRSLAAMEDMEAMTVAIPSLRSWL